MTLKIEGDITLLTLKEKLTAPLLVSTENTIELDFSKAGQVDSSVLSYVLHIVRHASRTGQSVYFSHLPPNFTELAQLYGVEDLLQLQLR